MKPITQSGFGLWKIVLTIALAVLLFAAFTAVASAATIYVPDDQGTIQDAVNAANPGDIVIVRDGTYTENVDVNKRLTIRSENGAASTIVQAANPNDHVFEVTTDYVTISGFTVKGTTEFYYAGIYLSGADNCIISNNKVSNNEEGIGLYDSSGNTLTSNTASNNDYGILLLSQSNGNTLTSNIASKNSIGIRLSESSDNILTSNTANSNNRQPMYEIGPVDWMIGIWLIESSGNILTGNIANSNNGDGIRLSGSRSSDNTLTSNTASNNGCGIYLRSSNDNTLTDNTANSNNGRGIWLRRSSNDNTLTSNTANSNNGGIVLHDSSGNTLTDNIANLNNECGIYLRSSNDNNTLTSNTANSNGWGIYLHDSSGNTLTSNTASNNEGGIYMDDSSGNTLTSNTASNNQAGIVLGDSRGNTLTSNTLSNNHWGIYLFSSSNNKIYINNFISNTNNVHPDGSNEWNSPSKITYTYKRRTYRNYLGNYWDDYTDVDANNNGIWDNPYSINGDNDNYPLVGRIRNHEIAPYYVHDMAVTDIYTSPHSPTVGQSATIYVTVTNEGDQQENNVPVTVKAYVGLSPFGRQVGSTRVTLSAGESTTESFTWTPSAAETYYLKGEVGIVSGETDTSDNTKTISVSVREQNQPPTCAIELRKQGTTTSINEIKVGEFFDIYVGDSTDDIGIVEVRFSSDDSQDGNPTGTWTSWYDWDTSSDDWDAVSKTKAWSFATEGSKEVWAEVKDDAGQTAKCSANIITEDLYWLAKVIASEAGSVWDVDHWVRCSDEERVAVGWTVLNRLESNEFPNTIKKVVEGGYAHNREPTQEIIDLSKDLLERRIPDPTGGATHFFSPIQQNEEGGYGPFIIPGSDIALIPNWAIPEEYSGEYNNGLIPQYESLPPSPPRIWEMPDHPYRTIDSPTRAAEWVGGLENVSNYYFMFYRPIGKNPPPNPPINLVQFKSDGETKIPVGGTTDERTIILKGNVRDPNGDKVKLQVELRRLDEYDGDFLGEFTQESNLEISGSQVSVPAYELVDDEYHWRARTVDEYGLTSEWMSFGNNDDLDIDFSVKIIPVDSDDDGLTDEEELNYGTDPNIQDSDDDGLSDKLEVDLALEYKPILALSEGELFYPTKVENFLDHSRLMEKPDKWIEGPEVSSESLKIYSTTEYYLDLAFGPPPDNNAEGRNDALRLWDEMEYHKPTTYVNVAPAGEYIAVQYWFFYIYNYFPAEDIFPNLDHEGDWEHVTVFIDRYSRVPVAVTYNRHIFDPEGVWWQNANKVGNHPMIYVGRGSHASYPQIGENYITKYKLDIPIASWDYHWGDGLWIQPRALNIALLQTQPWIYFEGKWGEQEILSPDGLMHRDSYFRNVDLEYQNSGLLYVHVASPVHLHAVDQYNRHVGVNKTGEMEVQIPEAEYSGPDAHPQWIAIHNSSLNITFYTTGIENRTFNMTLKKEKFLESKVHNFINISTTSSAITYVNSTSPNILKIDEDGDGTIDKTLSAPFANFSYSPLAPIVNQTITFDASLSYDPDGYIASCYWDFGDGSNASGSIVQHNYSKPGIYSVTLTVQDNNNQSSSTMVLLDINQPPIASFTYIPEKPVLNQTITFNASSSYDPDGYITNYEWDFGDGNITNTTEEIITHAYASAGDYTVNLTVTDNDGAPSTYTQSIFINRIQKGISYAAWWHDTYASTDSDISLENLKDTCTEWVSLVVTWYQDNASSTEIYRDDNRTPTDDSLIHAINKIHSLNMSVMLKPTVDLQDDNWRGNINFDNIAYSDALGLGWQDWSWDCNRNFESTTSVYRGKYAINVSFEPWGGLSFANPEGVNTDRYDSLEFYINGGERGGQQLRLSVTDDKGNELPSSGGVSINNPKYVHDGIISAKIWKLVSVPLEDLNATNTKIIKINIMDNTGHAQPALYIDDVMLTAPQSKWNEWFSSYEQFILHYADLAEKNNCEQFCVGVEYKGTVQRENNWRDIIEKVKEHYTGPITYASNWDNYQNINWWDASDLDFVGIDAYFPLTEKTDPTVDELKEGWKKWEEEIESWQQRVNKSIVFTEIGYCSLDGTNIEPWNWTYSDIVDLQEQADCYNATFQTFWNKPWLAGIYWWMWDTDPDVGGPLDKSYTPYKKPAESIVKKYYCAEKVSFLYKERLIGGPV